MTARRPGDTLYYGARDSERLPWGRTSTNGRLGLITNNEVPVTLWPQSGVLYYNRALEWVKPPDVMQQALDELLCGEHASFDIQSSYSLMPTYTLSVV